MVMVLSKINMNITPHFAFALTRALRARRARPPEVAEKLI